MSVVRLRADAARIPLAGGSVHCCVTSPPYFGLRRYEGVPETVWGGDPAHAHLWGEALPPIKAGQVAQTKWQDAPAVAEGQRANTGAYCLCGAWRGCLGGEPTVSLYVEHLVDCLREVRRVLRDDGTLWLNLGDSYGRTRARYAGNASRGVNGKHGLVPDALPDCGDGNEMDGQLLGVPWRVAFALQADGWLLRSDVVWSKVSAMPESITGWRWQRHRIAVASATVKRDGPSGSGRRPHGAEIGEPQRLGAWPDRPQQGHAGHDFRTRAEWAECPGCDKCAANGGLVLRRGRWRPVRAHEFVFLLAKPEAYFCDGEAVAEPSVATHGSGNGYARHYRESFRGAGGPRGGEYPWEPTAGGTRNPRDVWTLGPEPLHDAHYAAMPTEIPRRCILAGTPTRGVCGRCGAPWAPVVVRQRTLDGKPSVLPAMRTPDGQESAQGIGHWRITSEGRTSGWCATCPCPAADPVPATVLDPFAGSGTTGLVAAELGRRAILCDLSGTYLREIAGKRVGAAALAGQVSTSGAAVQEEMF